MTERKVSSERVSEERLREIIAGCRGVTPGPWDESAGLVRAIDGDVAIPIFETREPWKKHRRASTVFRQEWHNRHHVRRLDPDTVKSMASELLALRSSVKTVGPSEYRRTFTIPDGHEAVLDADGRATGETRPMAPSEVSEEMVERAHKAQMSELFLRCQPDRGDVFSFMDDRKDVMRSALTAALKGDRP